jgi:hypothetical protein
MHRATCEFFALLIGSWSHLSIKSTAECPAVYHLFYFESHEISACCQDLVKDINPTNAAILAVYPDIGPRVF